MRRTIKRERGRKRALSFHPYPHVIKAASSSALAKTEREQGPPPTHPTSKRMVVGVPLFLDFCAWC